MTTVNAARMLLREAGLFFDFDPNDDDSSDQTLNLNDSLDWASADAEYVPDEELPRLHDLFWRYGWCGVLYWVFERREIDKCEFTDVNRFVEFVRAEERIREEEPNDTKRAYLKRQYTIGDEARQTALAVLKQAEKKRADFAAEEASRGLRAIRDATPDSRRLTLDEVRQEVAERRGENEDSTD